MRLAHLSIELTNRCGKGCPFCYNGSHGGGDTCWLPGEVIGFVRDAAAHGVRAVSFGGGEPLEYAGVFDVLAGLRGVLFRSVTTNGLSLDGPTLDRLAAAGPDKVHVSVHFPERDAEVERAVRLVRTLEERRVRGGVNLLVARSKLPAAARAAWRLRAEVGNDRIVYLPMRGGDTPTAAEVAAVAGGGPFRTMSCLLGCEPAPPFCSVGWDRSVGWCSFTTARRPLAALTYAGLCEALSGLGLTFCGERARPEEEGRWRSLPPAAAPAGRLPRLVFVVRTAGRDLPAAHSMDTTWCAVDRNGFMGVFFTGEDGYLPTGAEVLDDYFALVRELRGERTDDEGADIDRWDEFEQMGANAGLSLYQYVGEFSPLAVHYRTMYGAGSLRHVNESSPRIRRLFKKLRLAGVDFSRDENIQLLDHFPPGAITFWGEDPDAYLAGDQKTVRPVPGREERFADFVREYRRDSAGYAKGRTFEGVPDEPDGPPQENGGHQ